MKTKDTFLKWVGAIVSTLTLTAF